MCHCGTRGCRGVENVTRPREQRTQSLGFLQPCNTADKQPSTANRVTVNAIDNDCCSCSHHLLSLRSLLLLLLRLLLRARLLSRSYSRSLSRLHGMGGGGRQQVEYPIHTVSYCLLSHSCTPARDIPATGTKASTDAPQTIRQPCICDVVWRGVAGWVAGTCKHKVCCC